MEIRDDDIFIVRRSVLFGALDEAIVADLIADASVVMLDRSEVLFIQDDPATHLFIVLEGWVKVYRMTPAGEEAIVGVFSRGQNFAEAAAFAGGAYPASAEAVTASRVMRIPMKRLAGKITETPAIGLAMLASTSQHLHQLVRQIEQLKAHTGAQRVAEFLVSIAPDESGPCRLALPYDKALLAGKLGMKPESLSRAFQRLKACGVSIERDEAVIRDVADLIDFMEQERAEVLKARR